MPSSLNVNTMRAVSVVVLAASLMSASTAWGQPTLAQPGVTYDSVMKLDRDARLTLMQGLTAVQRTEILITHIQRWIIVNRARLSSLQISLLEERIALYREEASGRMPKARETSDRFNDLQRRSYRAFPWEEMNQIVGMREYIPKAETVP
jgi:hypothetical protein